jgi:hypothetical protein
VDDGAFLAFWLRQQTITAAMNVNIWDVNDQLRSLIGRRISTDRLSDTRTALEALRPGRSAMDVSSLLTRVLVLLDVLALPGVAVIGFVM